MEVVAVRSDHFPINCLDSKCELVVLESEDVVVLTVRSINFPVRLNHLYAHDDEESLVPDGAGYEEEVPLHSLVHN